MEKTKSPLGSLIEDLTFHIDKTEDQIARYGLLAAREMAEKRLSEELKLIGLSYDDGASARYDYEYGRHYAKDKIK